MKKGYRVLLVFAMALLFTVVCKTGVQAASDVTLKNGKWTNGTFASEETDQYYKINVKKTGYIRVEYTGYNSEIKLCNAQKKNIVKLKERLFSDKIDASIGVKKGTYYIHIDGGVTGNNYKIRYTFTAMKKIAKPGQLKKAQTIRKNKQVSGIVLPGTKDGRIYYRLNLSEKQTVKFQYEIGSDNWLGVTMQITDAKGKILGFNDNWTVDKSRDAYPYYWDGKGTKSVVLEPGTYYFTIRIFQKGTGYYKLKIK